MGSEYEMEPTISVQRTARGWAWTYREGELELESNEDYPTHEEALDAARRAYPEVPVDAGDA